MRITPLFGQKPHLRLINSHGLVTPTRQDRALMVATDQLLANQDAFAQIGQSLDLISQAVEMAEDSNMETIRKLVQKGGRCNSGPIPLFSSIALFNNNEIPRWFKIPTPKDPLVKHEQRLNCMT